MNKRNGERIQRPTFNSLPTERSNMVDVLKNVAESAKHKFLRGNNKEEVMATSHETHGVHKTEKAMKEMGDRIMTMLSNFGADAWDELKTGIDKAWHEVRMGVDKGLYNTGQGINRAWAELAESIEHAKDSLLRSDFGAKRDVKDARHRKDKLS